MGIPYYFYTLTKSYKSIIGTQSPVNPDVYCMDFNGVIHPIAAKFLDSGDEDAMIAALYNKVIEDIQMLKPKTVYICVDGVVPLAKMIQQRKRRYLTVYRNKIDNVQPQWDTNAITPGTEFMQKLNTYFKKQIRYSTSDIKIVFSGSDEYGEGEHKIFSILSKTQTANTKQTIIINGLDADLIILSLMSQFKNIYLMRESDKGNTVVCINSLRQAIVRELMNKWAITCESDENDIIESYCVMCSLLGNDFIPHLLTLNLKGNGLDKLIQHTGNAYRTYGLLVHNGQINYMCLSDILQSIAKTEQNDLHTEMSRYIHNNSRASSDSLPSELFALKNKDPTMVSIYSSISNWRQLYYKAFFSTNISIDSSVITSACFNYIKGIFWTYAYYKRQPIDKLWYYPYGFPPSVRDVANYTLGNTDLPIVSDDSAIELNSKMQLLIVLPKESKNLLDIKLQKFMEQPSLGLYHLYPKTYKIHTFMKTHLWECVPELPTINIHHISRIMQKTLKKNKDI